MNFIKTLLFSFFMVLLIIPASIAVAQKTESNHSLQPGANALQFQITDDFILESFTGSVFSYKRQVSDTRAKRVGLSIGTALRDRDFTDDGDTRRTDAFINLSATYTWQNYINPNTDVKFYYGYGPGVSFGYDRSETDDENQQDVSTANEIGISGLGYAGVEWFFQQSMSLHAEYQASAEFSFTKNRQEVDNGTDEESNTKNFRFGGNGVLFGLSVYF